MIKNKIGSNLSNNRDLVWFDNPIFLKIGSACYFKGERLLVNSSYFIKNDGQTGGSICIYSADYVPQIIIIENSIFNDNIAGHGGAIGFAGNFVGLTSLIQNNYFTKNYAESQ